MARDSSPRVAKPRSAMPGLAAAVGLQTVPKEGVVPNLRSVIVDATGGGLLHDVFEAHILEFGALDQIVQVRDIRRVVLTIVVVERLAAHVGLQGSAVERQRRQGMFHGESLFSWTVWWAAIFAIWVGYVEFRYGLHGSLQVRQFILRLCAPADRREPPAWQAASTPRH